MSNAYKQLLPKLLVIVLLRIQEKQHKSNLGHQGYTLHHNQLIHNFANHQERIYKKNLLQNIHNRMGQNRCTEYDLL